MDNSLIYLDTYILQQDMRVRLPKSVLENINAYRGKTKFDIYLNTSDNSIVLKIKNEKNIGEKQ